MRNKDPHKLGPYDARDDYPRAKATRRRRGANQFARRQARKDIAEQLA